MQKELNLFKELFAPYPNIAILHLDNSLDLVTKTLEEIKVENEGHIKYINFKTDNSINIKVKPREFEYVVLSDILFHCEDKKSILKLMYKTLENSGDIIILEKKSNDNLIEIMETLEEVGFQVPNNIELFESFNTISAKKVYNWGQEF